MAHERRTLVEIINLPALASRQYDSPAPAIQVGEVLQDAHLVAAAKQLQAREAIAILHPHLITEEEVVAAMRRVNQIKRAQFDILGPNGDPAPDWVQIILARMDANELQQQQWQNQRQEVFQEQQQESQQQQAQFRQEWQQQQQEWQQQQAQFRQEWQQQQQEWQQQQQEWQQQQAQLQQEWQQQQAQLQQEWQQQQAQLQQEWQQQQDQFQQGLQQQITLLSRQLLQESQRSTNRAIRTNRDALVPVVRIEDGQHPANFPTTMTDCMNATGPRINLLLGFYNLSNRGTLSARKERLQRHLGCNL